MSSYHIFDLKKIARELERRKTLRKLMALIKRFDSIISAQRDLRTAADCLDILVSKYVAIKSFGEVKQDSKDATIGASLSSHAVISYYKAVSDDNDGRTPLRFYERYPEEWKPFHKHIRTLRSQAIAHYGTDRVWRNEAILLRLGGSRITLHSPYTAHNYRGNEVTKFRQLCDIAVKILEEDKISCENALLSEINKSAASSEFRDLLSRHHFDAYGFFRSEAGVASFEKAMNGEYQNDQMIMMPSKPIDI